MMKRAPANPDLITLRGDQWPAFMAWLSWSMHCYACGVVDTRKRAVVISGIGAALGLAAGYALGAAL